MEDNVKCYEATIQFATILDARTCNVPVKNMLKPSLKIILFAWVPTLILTTYIPELSLFLPRLFGFAV